MSLESIYSYLDCIVKTLGLNWPYVFQTRLDKAEISFNFLRNIILTLEYITEITEYVTHSKDTTSHIQNCVSWFTSRSLLLSAVIII